jgi:hypothetical protein
MSCNSCTHTSAIMHNLAGSVSIPHAPIRPDRSRESESMSVCQLAKLSISQAAVVSRPLRPAATHAPTLDPEKGRHVVLANGLSMPLAITESLAAVEDDTSDSDDRRDRQYARRPRQRKASHVSTVPRVARAPGSCCLRNQSRAGWWIGWSADRGPPSRTSLAADVLAVSLGAWGGFPDAPTRTTQVVIL